MVLLRHWSIMESIYHSIDLACLFKVWTNKGKKKLNEFLADLGSVFNFVLKFIKLIFMKLVFELLIANKSILIWTI